jgi:beta-N-acetylhexosaminidase
VPEVRATPSPRPTSATPKRRPKPSAPHTAARKPAIVDRPIPFGAKRRQEMAAYAKRHYGIDTYRLVNPHVIVEHYTGTPSFSATYNTFAADVADPELHELPNVCAHFVIDTDGTIYQLVPLGIMCRHTVGLNYTAIGIEHVGIADSAVLGKRRVLHASLELTNWLRCRYGIKIRDVIGHNESLTSPYHMERDPRLKTQTHGDMTKASMDVYRGKLSKLSCT